MAQSGISLVKVATKIRLGGRYPLYFKSKPLFLKECLYYRLWVILNHQMSYNVQITPPYCTVFP